MHQGQVSAVDPRSLYFFNLQPCVGDTSPDRPDPIGPLRVPRARIVVQNGFVAGNQYFHPLTLPHVTGMFRVEGSWPSRITISHGWSRAIARRWNDESPDAFLRLERGRSEFLKSATREVTSISGSGVFSPAMFPGSMRVWARAGYEEIRQLEVMERPLGTPLAEAEQEIRESRNPDWDRILEIDRDSFRGFWRMSPEGLSEALHSTRPSAVLTAHVDREVVGYAIVGSQWGTAYLQRVAVDAHHRGLGLGTDLVRACVGWARQTSAGSMVLNVRSENSRAKRVYERAGFTDTHSKLHLLRFGTTTLLN